MKYFQDPITNQVAGFDPNEPLQLPYMQAKIDAGWTDITGSWPPGPTLQQTQDQISSAITSALNDGAQQWGYDSIEAGVSYATSPNAQWAAEGQALNVWRTQVWEWAITKWPTITTGESPAVFLIDMPDLQPKPVE
jgi:hypothetical protein